MNEEETAPSEPSAYENLRKVSDARELRALAHPVRMALYEAFALHRSLTATQAAKLVGGTPSSVSYHLRTLAKYGYVEETNEGTGRERPWRMRQIGYSFSDNSDDPETNAAAQALSRLLFRRWLDRYEEFRRTKDRWPADVREVAGNSNMIVFGTAEEVEALQADISRLFGEYFDRVADPTLRPEGSYAFELQLFTQPVDPSAFAPEGGPAAQEN